jgi:hypothetical protein
VKIHSITPIAESLLVTLSSSTDWVNDETLLLKLETEFSSGVSRWLKNNKLLIN